MLGLFLQGTRTSKDDGGPDSGRLVNTKAGWELNTNS